MGTYLRGLLVDFGELEIVYKIETPVWMSGFDNQVVVSILKQGSKTVDWMSGEIRFWRKFDLKKIAISTAKFICFFMGYSSAPALRLIESDISRRERLLLSLRPSIRFITIMSSNITTNISVKSA